MYMHLFDDEAAATEALANFCKSSADILQIVGYFLLVFKIVIPIIIIILGMIDLGKAVVSSDEKAIQKSAKTLLIRVLAGILIFFVPTIVGIIFGLVTSFRDEVRAKWAECKACVVSPTGSECKAAVCIAGHENITQEVIDNCKANYK